MLQILKNNYKLLDKYLYTPTIGVFLGFFLVWGFTSSCGSTKMTLEEYSKKYPCVEKPALITTDTIYQVDTFPQYVTVDCDSVIKSNREVFLIDSSKAAPDVKVVPKSNKVVKEVFTYSEKKQINTTINTNTLDTAKLVACEEMYQNLQIETIEKDKKYEKIEGKLNINRKWKLYFLIALLISLLLNVIQFKFRK